MGTYILHNPQIVDITIKGKLTECIIASAHFFNNPYAEEFLISTDDVLIEKLRPFINKTTEIPENIRRVFCYSTEWYDLGGEYVKLYDSHFNFHEKGVFGKINGVEYFKIHDKYKPLIYTKIRFMCQHDNYGNPIEGSEPGVIGEALKKQCFIKYDPLLHPIIKCSDSGNNRQ